MLVLSRLSVMLFLEIVNDAFFSRLSVMLIVSQIAVLDR